MKKLVTGFAALAVLLSLASADVVKEVEFKPPLPEVQEVVEIIPPPPQGIQVSEIKPPPPEGIVELS